MPRPRRNLLGQRKGVLTVVQEAPTVNHVTYWYVQCVCGRTWRMETQNFARKANLFLDCLHEMDRRKELYRVHQNMILRCCYPSSPNFKNYGGRGIKVCDQWKNFKNFYRDVISLYIPGFEIDRINNDGNYEPGNIRWVSSKENCRNNRNCKANHDLAKEIRASSLPAKDLAKMYNLSYSAIRRIQKGKTWA